MLQPHLELEAKFGDHDGIGDTYAVAALARKRAELAGDIERTHEKLRKMVADLGSLDSTFAYPIPISR